MDKFDKFIGRTKELKELEDSTQSGPSLIVIKGRRRIGKSRLVKEHAKRRLGKEYAEGKTFLEFSGLASEEKLELTAQDQRDHFSNQLVHQLKIPPCTFKNWYDAFIFLSSQLTNRPTIILFDEISWMAESDLTFIPKLKAWWDTSLQKYPNVQLILCSSVSTWVEKNIINSTALFGRISLPLTLDELSSQESNEFLKCMGFKGSAQDIFKILSVTGGVPWYLKHINPQSLADENIQRLCFTKNGLLTHEFDRIFNDLYKGENEIYKKIVYALADGMKTLSDLREVLGYEHGGFLSKYMKNLCTAGFVTQHNLWSFKTHKKGKQSLFRLSDNYLRFYIKYIEPNLEKIKQDGFSERSMDNLPGWQATMGIHIENLLLKNRSKLLKAIGIKPGDSLADNPYIQKSTKKHKGCQIDYLIQTYTNTLFICEFKIKRHQISPEIMDEMKEKIKRLDIPRGFGKAPVLVHMSDLAESIEESRYFYKTIDLRDWLEEESFS